MSIWLKYLAVVTLVGNGLTAGWNLLALARTIRIGALSEGGVGLIAFNLFFSFAAVALAALIAAPARRAIDLRTKVIAAPSIVGGGIGVLSAAMGLYARAGQTQTGLLTDDLAVVIDALYIERGVQTFFFSACTLALAVLVIASRRSADAV